MDEIYSRPELESLVPESKAPADVSVTPVEALQKKKTIFRTYQVVWYVLGVLEVLLAFRFVLKLFAANPNNAFATFIYTLTYIFVYTFMGLFPSPVFGPSIFEFFTIIAMIVYWIIAFGIVKIMQLAKPPSQEEVVRKVDSPMARL